MDQRDKAGFTSLSRSYWLECFWSCTIRPGTHWIRRIEWLNGPMTLLQCGKAWKPSPITGHHQLQNTKCMIHLFFWNSQLYFLENRLWTTQILFYNLLYFVILFQTWKLLKSNSIKCRNFENPSETLHIPQLHLSRTATRL